MPTKAPTSTMFRLSCVERMSFRSTTMKLAVTELIEILFCFYYDIDTNEYKVFAYKTRNLNEAGFGVPLNNFLKNVRVVKTGKDFKELANGTSDYFAKEHLNAMHLLFKNSDISKTMFKLTAILNRMIKPHGQPQLSHASTRDAHEDIGGYKLYNTPQDIPTFSMHYRDNYNKFIRTFNIPISINVMKTGQHRDVLGKSIRHEYRTIFERGYMSGRRVDSSPAMTKVNLHYKHVVGFDDINFIFTAESLLKQYKIRHRLVDTLKYYKLKSKKAIS